MLVIPFVGLSAALCVFVAGQCRNRSNTLLVWVYGSSRREFERFAVPAKRHRKPKLLYPLQVSNIFNHG